ncbi:Chloramphenicol acetyltransferase-like domain-containing protein [Artemisia annua]|uniref:Chloramphenicol acetyltransferase-like domain-containing protein n=1 Tax=Artemisia annua TaxID=35608 RepID=A0A2U1Q2J6_ARTAN|nr:Chloramphenicol acetyltransferase-like domain-containing protein [Artemisia annua]
MEIEIISKEFIKPSSPTPPHLKTFKLSVLDQIPNVPYGSLILFYPNLNGNNLSEALEKSVLLKKSLSKTLTQFYPLAGMIQKDYSIECNDFGASYVSALVHLSLENFLVHPDHQMMHRFLPLEPSSLDESSEFAHVTHVQVSIFKCGGIAIGACVSHKVVDASGVYTFLKGWANMTCGDKEVVYPNLGAPSLFPAKSLWLRDMSMAISQLLLKEGRCVTKRFVFSSDALATLKIEVARKGVQQPSRVEVVSALIWECAMEASKEAYGLEKPSLLTHAVNLRRKVATTLSEDILGNMVWFAGAVSPPSNEKTLHDLVKMVRESFMKISVEFVRKAQGDEGHVEMQKSLQEIWEIDSKEMGINSYNFTSWCKMSFYEIDFGWGKPIWLAGVVDEGAPVFINIVNLVDTKDGEGIEAWVNLDEEEMRILQANPKLLAYASIDPSPLIKNGNVALPIP